MATLVKTFTSTKYVLELNQDEAELIAGLLIAVEGNSKASQLAVALYHTFGNEVQGDRVNPIVDGVEYVVSDIRLEALQ
jgi:hypothetical protein